MAGRRRSHRANVSNVARADISWLVPRVAAVMKRFAVAAVAGSPDAVAVVADSHEAAVAAWA
jgi:hypothetical protein